jgi:flagellar motor switch protein FliN/FliY
MAARFLQDLQVEVIIELGRTKKSFKELASLDRDDVIDLDRSSDDPLDIIVGGKLFARGEVVMQGDRMAIRITEMVEEEQDRSVR